MISDRVKTVLTAAAFAAAAWNAAARDDDLPISSAHEKYLSYGVIACVHWGPNTYLEERKRNEGGEPASIVDPRGLDPMQWAKVLKAGGVRAAVLVAKHDDGFCLWPSRVSRDYSTRAMKGSSAGCDLVTAFEKACRWRKLGFGVAVSSWDRRDASFGAAAYLRTLDAQWAEILSRVDNLDLVVVDRGSGGRGWYGGVREGRGESRRVKPDYYRFAGLTAELKRRHPESVRIGGRGDGDVERKSGSRGEASDSWRYAQRGRDGETRFTVQEVLVPLRKSLFFREEEKPKSLEEMADIYFKTVGRGAVLAWGVAPDRNGLICEADARRLEEFGDYVRAFEASDYARGSMTGTAVGGGRMSGVSVVMGGPRTVDAVDFGEDLSKGQVVDGWTVEAHVDGDWKRVASGRSVGWRRIACFDPVTTTRVRVTCRGDRLAKIVNFAVRKTPDARR